MAEDKKYVDQFIDFKGHRLKINAIKMANGHTVQSDIPANIPLSGLSDTTYQKINDEGAAAGSGVGYMVPFPSGDFSQFVLLNAATKTWKALMPGGQEQSILYATPLNGIRDDGIEYIYDTDNNIIGIQYSEGANPYSVIIGSDDNVVLGQYATAAGEGTTAYQNEFVIGKYNNPDQNNIFTIGYGYQQNLKNIFSINKQGRLFMGLENDDDLYDIIQNFPWASEVVN